MKMPTFFRCAVSAAGITALLAGCSSGGSSPSATSGLAPGGPPAGSVVSGALNLPPSAAARARVDPAFALLLDKLSHLSAADLARFHPHRAWAAPDIARRPRLLFVSDGSTETVDTFTMPALNRVGQMVGFTALNGVCTDPATGNVWVVDSGAKEIVRLDRTLTVTGHLEDHNGRPYGCAVDPTTGDVAVTNLWGSPVGPGNVNIYKNGHGDGEPITDPNLYFYYYAGYDTSGDLWITGSTSGGASAVSGCTFPTGCTTFTLTGGALQLVNFVAFASGQRSWYVGDDDCGGTIPAHFCAYPVSASLGLGTPITLMDEHAQTVCKMEDPAVTAHLSRVLVGGVLNSGCGGLNSVARFSFPGGGQATHSNPTVGDPISAAISMK